MKQSPATLAALARDHEISSRQARRWRRLALAFAMVALVAVAASVAAVTIAIRKANEADVHERIATSRALADAALANVDRSPELGMLLALEAYDRVHDESPGRSYEARHSLLSTLERNARLTAVLQGYEGQASDIAFSPDGRKVAVVSATENPPDVIRLWDVAHGAPIGMPLRANASRIAFSGDGRKLFATGLTSSAAEFRAFDVARTVPLGEPLEVSLAFDDVGDIEASPNGRWVAVSGTHGLFRMWDAVRRAPLKGFLTSAPSWGGFSPDSRLYAEIVDDGCVCGHPGPLRLWNIDSRAPLGRPLPYVVSSFAFAPDGRTMVIGTGKRVIVWDIARRAPARAPLGIAGGVVELLAFGADGQRLAAAGSDGSITLWNLASDRRAGRRLPDRAGYVQRLEFSPDGHVLAVEMVSDPELLGARSRITLWDVDRKVPIVNPPRFPTEHYDGYTEFAFSPSSKTLAVAGDDGRLRLWEASNRTPLEQSVLDMAPHGIVGAGSIATSPDGRTLAVGDAHGVRLWDLVHSRPLGKSLVATEDFGDVDKVAFSPDGAKLAVLYVYEPVMLWDVRRRTPLGRVASSDFFPDVAFSHDGQTLAVSGPVRLFDVGSRRQLGKVLDRKASAVVFSPDGRTLATAEPFRLWDLSSRQAVGPPLNLGRIADLLAFSPDLRTVAKANGGTIRLWDVAGDVAIGGPPLRHADEVNDIAFSPDGRILVSVGEDDVVKLWDVTRHASLGDALQVRRGFPWGVTFSPDGSTLLTGHYDETIRFWDSILLSTDLDAWRERICMVVKRNLTDAEWRRFLPGDSYRKTCPQFD